LTFKEGDEIVLTERHLLNGPPAWSMYSRERQSDDLTIQGSYTFFESDLLDLLEKGVLESSTPIGVKGRNYEVLEPIVVSGEQHLIPTGTSTLPEGQIFTLGSFRNGRWLAHRTSQHNPGAGLLSFRISDEELAAKIRNREVRLIHEMKLQPTEEPTTAAVRVTAEDVSNAFREVETELEDIQTELAEQQAQEQGQQFEQTQTYADAASHRVRTWSSLFG
jgi:hypothetical protein